MLKINLKPNELQLPRIAIYFYPWIISKSFPFYKLPKFDFVRSKQKSYFCLEVRWLRCNLFVARENRWAMFQEAQKLPSGSLLAETWRAMNITAKQPCITSAKTFCGLEHGNARTTILFRATTDRGKGYEKTAVCHRARLHSNTLSAMQNNL